jgi:hypothetical protein
VIYYGRKGEPLDTMAWARLIEDRDYSTLAQHWVRGWKVSTIWIGIDHGWGQTAAPVIFETMIFAPKDASIGREDWEDGGDAFGTAVTDLDQYQERYATEAAAQAGHDRALAAMVHQLGDTAAMDVISSAQFSDPVSAPDDISGIA